MIWLAWRQFRSQGAVGAALAIALAAWTASLGLRLHAFQDDRLAGCTPATCAALREEFERTFTAPVSLTGAALLTVPVLVGIFWGAPLVARELESGTHRLAWTQSVSRRRWLATKLGLVTLAAVVVGGVLTALLTWATGPYDELAGTRFGAMTFGARGVVPVAYVVFAFLLGTTAGLLTRRALPAMALTLALVAAVQLVMPLAVRQHLLPAQTVSIAAEVAAQEGRIDGLGMSAEGDDAPVQIFGYELPGAWVLTERTPLVREDGTTVTAADFRTCQTGSMPGDFACLTREGGVHFDVDLQPASRYWPFQLLESGIVLALGLMLAGYAFRRIPLAAG